MNWLAHVFLSEPNAACRIGNLLPDLAKPAELVGLADGFQRGIRLHRAIDAFTDQHPVFLRSVGRINPPLRRYGPILVDIFYDHFLSRDWADYADTELHDFVHAFYGTVHGFRSQLPPVIYHRLERIVRGDWLRSYGEIHGVVDALERLSRRLRRPVNLAGAVGCLEREYADFRNDFHEFFPEVRKVVRETSAF